MLDFRKPFIYLNKSRGLLKSPVADLNLEKCFSLNSIARKTVPDNLKGKSKSSQEWLIRQFNDVYVKKSRYDNYRCRSAYKLLEIDEKYKILKPGLAVVDCGAAPGSWTQVVVKKLKLEQDPKDGDQKGVAIAVDLQYMDPIKGAVVFPDSDFTMPSVQEEIQKHLPNNKADVVLSDMAPRASGTQELDSVAIVGLVYSALKFSVATLTKDGTFLCKVWDSNEVPQMFKTLESLFSNVKRIKPKASRSNSSELFLLARGYKCDNFINKN